MYVCNSWMIMFECNWSTRPLVHQTTGQIHAPFGDHFGDRRTCRNFFFTEDEAPRRASNHGPLYGNYGNKYLLTTGDGQLHANLR